MKRTLLIPAFLVIAIVTIAPFTRAANVIDKPVSSLQQRNRLIGKKLVEMEDFTLKTVKQHLVDNCFPEKNITSGFSAETENPDTVPY